MNRYLEDLNVGDRAMSKLAVRAVRERDVERSPVEVAKRTVEQRDGNPLGEGEPSGTRFAAEGSARVHGRTDPFPGWKGGLWWNGTRFSHSRSACQ